MSSIQAIKTGGGGVWLSQRFFAKAGYGRIARDPIRTNIQRQTEPLVATETQVQN